MSKRIDDPVAVEMFVNHVIANREAVPTDYTPPPRKSKWLMYAATCFLPLPIEGSDKAVLACLISHANVRDGRNDPGQDTIAEETGLSERTVKRCIKRLLKSPYLKRDRRARASSAYHVQWSALEAEWTAFQTRSRERSERRKRANASGDHE